VASVGFVPGGRAYWKVVKCASAYSSRHVSVDFTRRLPANFYRTVSNCLRNAPTSLERYDWLIGAAERRFSLVQVVFCLDGTAPLRAMRGELMTTLSLPRLERAGREDRTYTLGYVR
jgi:hypothetical protein